MSGQDVQRVLGVAPRERAKLEKTGIITPVGAVGGATLYDARTIEQLAACADASIEPPAVAVRLGVPQSADDEWPNLDIGSPYHRAWRGWSESWDEETRANAARMWWRVADPDRFRSGLLLALVAQFIVDAWRIRGATVEDGYVAFTLEQSQRDRERLRFTRLSLGRGALVKSWL